MNLLRGEASDGRITAGELVLGVAAGDRDVAVGIRPEALVRDPADGPAFELTVEVVEPLGEQVVVHGTVAGATVESGAEEATEIPLALEDRRAAVTAVLGPGSEPSPGDRLRMGIAPDKVHLFDLASGEAIG